MKAKLAFFSYDESMARQWSEYDPVSVTKEDLEKVELAIEILLVDSLAVSDLSVQKLILKKRQQAQILKLVILYKPDTQTTLSTQTLSCLKPDAIFSTVNLKNHHLIQFWEEISQTAQDESYLHLSSELNSQYESIKIELQRLLLEKTNHLLQSRQQIVEINNRTEMLRKALFITSEVKTIESAEKQLNHFLTKNGKATWFKIIEPSQVDQFELDLNLQLSATFYKTLIHLANQNYAAFFFKGDRRSYKKNDQLFFNKLIENLQINLNRHIHLQSLQMSERLFDLAFHSSPHYILVINEDYQVLQANLAVEKAIQDENESNKCYELLFNRKTPCVSCHLGTSFQITNELKSYQIQSNRFQMTENSNPHQNYWIHLYQDISEKKALENKLEQTARLSELGLISSSIAHELNNPLGGIISYLQLMKMDLASDHPFQQDIELMHQTAQRIKKIIEELLLFSRKEEALQLEKVHLHEIVRKNIDLLQMQLKKENLKIVFQDDYDHVIADVSPLHFRSSIHLIFQYFLQQLKIKKVSKPQMTGLVQVKIFQDQMNSYLNFSSNLGPLDAIAKTNDMSLISLEKNILDQGFQMIISEPQPGWSQILITLPHTKDSSL